MKKIIEVVPYDPSWPSIFEEKAANIKNCLGDNLIATYHVGSTSVPGLAAKRDIDILAIVGNLEEALKLHMIGYIFKGEFNIPLRYFFSKNTPKSKVNLHVYNDGHPEIELNLRFRDYLRSHPSARDEYAELKASLLLDETAFEKNNSLFTNYTLRKGGFIRNILKLAEFNRLRILKCSDETEWYMAKHFRNKYFFDEMKIDDPYAWTFDSPDHNHLVLYQGAEIIGYAHIQAWPLNRAALRIIVIDETRRNDGFDSRFLRFCEDWLRNVGYKSIHVESSRSALAFYRKNFYIDTPFNDPDFYTSDPEDVAIGKIL
jgi:GrpB-like predicted nucleotidyltransferase (UPF0157 family)/GNAT superfamily N-acetyltransferase